MPTSRPAFLLAQILSGVGIFEGLAARKFVDARLALILAYAEDYDKMTDAKATELLNRRFAIQKQRELLDEKYRPQFTTALSPRRLVRFYQIEHQLQLLIELQAVSQIPKMKWW